MQQFNYPTQLNTIFRRLIKANIKPIIVGGYVRDFFLNIKSKDIDIELYNIDSLDRVEEILQPFGKVNSVGKSFGVVKLLYNDLDLDFSLPRSDSKTKEGHKGFRVAIQTDFDFTAAAQRRDFTMNAIGYDVIEKKLLDPYHGVDDLNKRLLRAVDLNKFGEDPLRVLRAIVFTSRFKLHIEPKLYTLLKEMMQKNVLNELPKERIFEEIKKLLLKSSQPSLGFKLLKELSGFTFFSEFQTLREEEFQAILNALDRVVSIAHASNEKEKITLMLAILTSKFSKEQQHSFLEKLTNQKEILKNVEKLTNISFELTHKSNYAIYKLATQTEIALFALYLLALYPNEEKKIKKLIKKAKELDIYHKALSPFVQGKDLITLGLKPSKEFSKILEEVYEKQLREELFTKEDCLEYLKRVVILS